MNGRVKILEIYPKSEEIMSFYPKFLCFCRLYTVLAITFQQNCHVLVTTLYNLNLTYQQLLQKEILKYWKQTTYLKKLHKFISYFVHLGTFLVILF